MNIYLARHGQTDWEVEGKTMGHNDIPINQTGRTQARHLADALFKKGIKRVYCSDLDRAAETAVFVGLSYGLDPIKDARLRERNIPDESHEDACKRWKDALNEIVVPLHGDIAIVAHDGPLRYFIQNALGMARTEKPLNTGAFDLDNCGITHLQYVQGTWKTLQLNGLATRRKQAG